MFQSVSAIEYSKESLSAAADYASRIVARRTPKAQPAQRVGATRRVMDALRELIVRRQVAAGQQVHQEQLAQLLGVSRIPVREALKALEAEGLLSHEPNRGYFVTVIRAEDLRQIYLMRRVIETEALKAVAWPDGANIKTLKRINGELTQAARNGAVNPMVGLNRDFHFAIFKLSNLGSVIQELERLWRMSEQYRVFYLTDESARRRVVKEHVAMIAALEAHDRPKLLALAHRHRKAAEEKLTEILRSSEG